MMGDSLGEVIEFFRLPFMCEVCSSFALIFQFSIICSTILLRLMLLWDRSLSAPS